jgi:hypothetical protein
VPDGEVVQRHLDGGARDVDLEAGSALAHGEDAPLQLQLQPVRLPRERTVRRVPDHADASLWFTAT